MQTQETPYGGRLWPEGPVEQRPDRPRRGSGRTGLVALIVILCLAVAGAGALLAGREGRTAAAVATHSAALPPSTTPAAEEAQDVPAVAPVFTTPGTPAPAPKPLHLTVRGWLFVPSPSAVRQNGTGLHACGGANTYEVERSWAGGTTLNFSTNRSGTNILASVRTSAATQLVYLRVNGKLTCGWQARFVAQLPPKTSTFFMRYGSTQAYWGPLARRAAKGWTFTYIHP